MNIDKNAPVPLYRQLGEAILKKINDGEFLPHEKLPAIRSLAAYFNVNNTTVVGAYRYLEQKQAVYSIRGSGTYAANKKNTEETAFKTDKNCINFADNATDPAYFPKESFRAAFDTVVARDGADAFGYPGWRGYQPLREIICESIVPKARCENIQIISDMNQGIGILAEALLNPGDAVVTETPCSQLSSVFSAYGVKILEVPFNENGLDICKLIFYMEKFKPKMFFLTPTFQVPTGLCYTNEEKAKIIELAHNHNVYIIEADSHSDFYYDTKPLSLFETDLRDHVIYIKTFDRVLAPGLAGFMVCPGDINLRVSVGASGYIQRGLDCYLRNNDFHTHCNFLRGNYARRYRRAVAAAETFLSPYVSFIKPGGGLSLWIKPNNHGDGIINGFLNRNVLVSPGRLYSSAHTEPHFRVSFANAPEDDISKGIGIIASVLRGNE